MTELNHIPEQKPHKTPLLNLDKIVKPMLILVIVGVVGNIAFCLWTTDRQKLVELLRFDGRYLLLAMLLTLVPLLGHTVRTIMWTRFLGYRIGRAKLFRIVLANELAASITPTAVGGGPLKIAMLVQAGIRTGAAACVTTLPTLEDLLFFIVAVPIAMPLHASSSWHHPVFNLIAEGIDLHWALPCLIVGLVGGGGLALLCRKSGLRNQKWERLQEQLKAAGADFLNVCRAIGGTGKSRLLAKRHYCRDAMDMPERCRCDACRELGGRS